MATKAKTYTHDDMRQQDLAGYDRGYREATARFRAENEAVARQKELLSVEQTKAVTDLIRASTENLSKAGYLIGKLNKDNSR